MIINKYDIIFISESKFQDKVVENLIENKFKDKKYLWLKKVDSGFSSNTNIKLNLNLNSFKSIIKSLFYFIKPINLECEKLISPQITGVHSRFLAKRIKHKSLEMFDDGIGTIVILENPNYFKDYKNQILKLSLIRTIHLFFNWSLIPNTAEIISKINIYYSVYPVFPSTLNTVPIKLLELNYEIINETAFIGMPLVEYGMVNKVDYLKAINKIIQIHGKIKYYPDDSETLIYTYKIDGLEIVKKETGIEYYFSKKGLPNNLYSFTSSALLNIRMGSELTNIFYIKIPNADSLRQIYYRIFDKCNIKEFQV